MTHPFAFPRSHRIQSRIEFSRVFEPRVRESRGPITIYAIPNELGHPRLGISIGKKVGTAPRRNRIKRLLREAFRLHQHDFPAGYDLVIVVRPHEPLQLPDYQRLLGEMVRKLHTAWAKRGASRPDVP